MPRTNVQDSREGSPVGETERVTTRRLVPSPNLFAVPEDREVLQTPQENQNSGYVFGEGGSEATEKDAMKTGTTTTTEDGGEGSTSPHKETPTVSEGSEVGEKTPTTVVMERLSGSDDDGEAPVTPPGSRSPEDPLDDASDPGSPPVRPNPEPYSPDPYSSPEGPESPEGGEIEVGAELEDEPFADPEDPAAVMGQLSPDATPPEETNVEPPPDPTAVLTGSGCLPGYLQANGYTFNGTRGYTYIGPSQEEIREIDEYMAAVQREREQRSEQLRQEEAQRRQEERAKRAAALRPFREVEYPVYEYVSMTWEQQYEAAKALQEEERRRWIQSAKRGRDSDEEEALLSEADRERRAAAMKSMTESFKEAEERHKREPLISMADMKKVLPRPFTHESYYMQPNRREMQLIVQNCGIDALKAVSNVRIGREGYGEIFFKGPINLEGLNVEKELEIKRGHLQLKEVDQLGGHPATVTLHNVYMNLFADVYRQTSKACRKVCEKPGCTFVSYSVDGTWVFEVEDLKEHD